MRTTAGADDPETIPRENKDNILPLWAVVILYVLLWFICFSFHIHESITLGLVLVVIILFIVLVLGYQLDLRRVPQTKVAQTLGCLIGLSLLALPFSARYLSELNMVSVEAHINLGLLLAALLGALIAYYELRSHRQAERRKFLTDLYSDLFGEPDLRDIYYKIERGDFEFTLGAFEKAAENRKKQSNSAKEDHEDEHDEHAIDRLLALANLVCGHYADNVLTPEDMRHFEYEFRVIWRNPQVRAYLKYLERIYAVMGVEPPKNGDNKRAFPHFRKYCREQFKTPVRKRAPKWEQNTLEINLRYLREKIQRYYNHSNIRNFRALWEQIENHIRFSKAGNPLAKTLSRVSTDIQEQPHTDLYGRLLAALCNEDSEMVVRQALETLSELFKWAYGVEPIRTACRTVGWSEAARFLESRAACAPQRVKCLWFIGVVHYVDQMQGRSFAHRLQERSRWDPGLTDACLQITRQAKTYLKDKVAGELNNDDTTVQLGQNWSEQTRLLWYNAAVMSLQHHPNQSASRDLFGSLLDHLKDLTQEELNVWKTEDGKVLHFDENALCQQSNTSTFLQHCSAQRYTAGCTYNVEFLDNPLEILNLGNTFGSCLRLGGEETDKLLGWATNCTIRVVVVRDKSDKTQTDKKGRIVGRRTIGLSVEPDHGGILQAPTYPPDDPAIKEVIDKFLEDFPQDPDLKLTRQGIVRDTCAPAYAEWVTLPVFSGMERGQGGS
ncbi:MAG: hypothetical protein R6V19_02440 [Armatimonadota bacterium]